MFVEKLESQTLPGLNVAKGPENGPPLVVFHGVTRRWQCQIPLLQDLASRWQVFAVDLPGHGHSRFELERYRVADYCENIAAWMESKFQQSVVLMGHSLGAMIAAELAGRPRIQTAATILIDPPFQTMGQRIGQTPLLSYFQGVQGFAGRGTSAVAEMTIAELTRQLGAIVVANPQTGDQLPLSDTRSDTVRRFMASCLKQLDPPVLEPIVAGEWLEGYSLANVARRLTPPTLLFQADPAAGGMLIDEDVELLQGWARDLTTVRATGHGHSIQWSDAALIVKEATLFLETLPLRQQWAH